MNDTPVTPETRRQLQVAFTETALLASRIAETAHCGGVCIETGETGEAELHAAYVAALTAVLRHHVESVEHWRAARLPKGT